MYRIFSFIFFAFAFVLTSCETNMAIVNNVDEREANEIVVFLASKGIKAEKIQGADTGIPTGGASALTYSIMVDGSKATEAMSLLNQFGLPRKKGTSLLELFAKQGLMSSDKEETIRFQAGLAEQLKNTIRKIDGIIDADVQISFPVEEPIPGEKPPKITAAVYVKHQGIFENPNEHLESKIKRLVSGSISGLDYDSVAVISDRSRFTEVSLGSSKELISSKNRKGDLVSIWSIVMTKSSLGKFRGILFFLIFLVLFFGTLLGWILYHNYPSLAKKLQIKNLIPKRKKPS